MELVHPPNFFDMNSDHANLVQNVVTQDPVIGDLADVGTACDAGSFSSLTSSRAPNGIPLASSSISSDAMISTEAVTVSNIPEGTDECVNTQGNPEALDHAYIPMDILKQDVPREGRSVASACAKVCGRAEDHTYPLHGSGARVAPTDHGMLDDNDNGPTNTYQEEDERRH